jgi:hypothetical protein
LHRQVHVAVVAGGLLGKRKGLGRNQEAGARGGGAVGGRAFAREIDDGLQVARDDARVSVGVSVLASARSITSS